jgi:NAD+ synthase (glutamine-hydrolysing)
MTKPALTITVAQTNFIVGDIEYNAQRILDISNDSDLVIFPELALSGYPPEDLLIRPNFHRRCEAALTDIVNKCTSDILLGYPTKDSNKIYNSAVHISQNKIQTIYHKQALPNYAIFDEKRYFTQGNKNGIITVKGVAIGVLICEDLWREEPLKKLIKENIKFIICINASPFSQDKINRRAKLISDRCKKHNINILYVNTIGGQDEVVFDGGSTLCNKQGGIIWQAPHFEENTTTLSFNENLELTSPASPTTKKEPIQNVYSALTLGVKDYIGKNNFKGAILGLSGGIDSALSLAIACDAIGPQNVRVLIMPSQYTAAISNEYAIKMASNLGVKYDIINIEEIYNTYIDSLDVLFNGLDTDSTEENIQARIRGNLLMALSNKTGSIVLTTGNKSEFSVGYCTLYGDMAGAFSVLKDVLKTQVYALSNYRNSLSDTIPKEIINRAPTAELKADQLDQDSLPPYPILDKIIDLHINQDLCADDIVKEGLDKATVKRIIRLIQCNEYKRRQAPIGIRLSDRAFGRDRRYPITSKYL